MLRSCYHVDTHTRGFVVLALEIPLSRSHGQEHADCMTAQKIGGGDDILRRDIICVHIRVPWNNV